MPQKTKRKGVLSTDVRGRYVRSVGKYQAPSGRHDPRRFVLGRDPVAAQEAAARLKRLWLDVKAEAERKGETPLWNEEAAAIALRIAKGERQIVVEFDSKIDEFFPKYYLDQYRELKRLYPSVALIPSRPDLIERGTTHYAEAATRFSDEAETMAARANIPVPKKGSGKKLYDALDAYQQFVKSSPDYVRSGKITAWGKRLCLRSRVIDERAQVIGNPHVLRTDVAYKTCFKTMVLIRAVEMHAADQRGFVTRCAQRMSERRHITAQRIAVDLHAGLMGIQPGHETRPRRHA